MRFSCLLFILFVVSCTPKNSGELKNQSPPSDKVSSNPEEKLTSVPDHTNESIESVNEENMFEVASIEFITIEGENYLRVHIKDRNPNGQFYSYPSYKIVSSDGKVIGELDFERYGLAGPEDIPTTLTALPENFECVVHLSAANGGMGLKSHELVYKSK